MSLFSSRKRAAEFAEREAAGERLWTDELDARVRRRLDALWEIADRHAEDVWRCSADISTSLRLNAGWDVADEIRARAFVASQERGTEFALDLLEAFLKAYAREQDIETLTRIVNDIFYEHRVGFRVVDGKVVPVASDELHESVVVPALRLLVDARFEKAHAAYLKALQEIADNDPGDAITDAGTALQEALTALGCRGNTIGALIKDAQSRGMLAPHDARLADGIKSFVDWAHADRNTTGDAHKHTDAIRDDAWLMVHVVGALIIRLASADGDRRKN